MPLSRYHHLAAVFLVALWSTAADAAQADGAIDDIQFQSSVVRMIRANKAVDDIKTQLLQTFRATDVDGKGVSQSDYDLTERMNRARNRAARLKKVLDWDLDGDGRVSRDELDAAFEAQANRPLRSNGMALPPSPDQVAQIRKKLVDGALKYDRDGNGVIEFAEALATVNDELARPARRYSYYSMPRHRVPLSLDRDGDGVVSETEYLDAVMPMLRQFDRNGDGTYSAAEASAAQQMIRDLQAQIQAAVRKRQQEERQRRERERNEAFAKSCGFPAVPEGARTLLASVYAANALSSVDLGGSGEDVSVADVEIEPGETPLYVVLTSFKGTIWRFSGATDRLVQVVANAIEHDSANRPLAGVVGVPAKRIYFSPDPKCTSYFSAIDVQRIPKAFREGSVQRRNREWNRARSLFVVTTGRPPDLMFGREHLLAIHLPSGRIDAPPIGGDSAAAAIAPKGGDADMLRNAMRIFVPGGVVDIHTGSIVSRTTVEPLPTPPGFAGLAQLIERGALELIETRPVVLQGKMLSTFANSSDASKYAAEVGTKAREFPYVFRVLKEMRFPPGLSGYFKVKFVVPKGVAKPSGSPGPSEVVYE